MTMEALYLVAGMDDEDQQAAVKAIIKETKKRHVTLKIAHAIIDELEEAAPPPVRKPPEPKPIEPLDDEDGDEPDDTSIVPDDDDDDDDEPSEDVLTAGVVDTALDFSVCHPVWPKVIKRIGGPVVLRQIIDHLNAIYDRHCDKGPVQSAADRAEAKAAQTAKKTEKESSDV